MKLNEFGTNDVRGVNNYGSAAFQRKQNQLAGNADANLTTKETLGKNIFVNKFIQKASAGLDNAVKSGAISATAPVQPTQPTQPTQSTQPTQPTQSTQPTQPTQSTTTGPSPEEIRKQKQAAAVRAIDAKPEVSTTKAPTGTAMPTTPYQIPGLGTNPNQTKSTPQQPTKMTPQQTAALKGRLKAGSGATSSPSGFKDYTAGSGERMTGVDQSGAPIFKKIQRESKFDKLNIIFESIVNEQSPTISSFVLDAWKAYLQGVDLSNPQIMTKAQELANQVQATYAKDKGTAALNQLADLAWYASSASAVSTGQNKVDNDDYEVSSPSYSGEVQGTGTMIQAYGKVRKILSTLGKNERTELITALQNAEEKANI